MREYSTGRVAVVPSFFEGFGFPASEAMACGLPVVANAAGALPEVVGTDGSTRAAGAAARPAAPSPPRSPTCSPTRSRLEAHGPRRAGARRRPPSAGATPPRSSRAVLEETTACCSPSISTRLGVGPGQLLLDAGCGEGRHCFGALERGARVVGLDLDLASLRKAAGALRFRGREKGALAAMLQGDAFRLPFADASFDRVICAEVMEHVHDYRGAARELARVTRPGGRVAVTIPTATSEHLYLRLGDDYFESPGGHIRIFRPARPRARRCAAAGLATEGVGFAHALPHALLGAALGGRPAARRRLRAWCAPTGSS